MAAQDGGGGYGKSGGGAKFHVLPPGQVPPRTQHECGHVPGRAWTVGVWEYTRLLLYSV